MRRACDHFGGSACGADKMNGGKAITDSVGCAYERDPAVFTLACRVAFIGSVATTIYFCRSMGGGMEMPCGWTMSMTWMRMPGQSWTISAILFLLMWLAMMVAMMLPSALPTFLKTRRRWHSLCFLASGYFVVWLAAGVGVYLPGIVLAAVAMQSNLVSHAIPWLLGASLIAAGTFQLTRWKMVHLLRCRSPFGCAAASPRDEASFWLGCKQGVSCCFCCAPPMTMLLAFGMMNPPVIIVVAMVIAAEKLLTRPAMVARLVGISSIIAGAFVVWLQLRNR